MQRILHFAQSEEHVMVCKDIDGYSISKNDRRRGTFEEDLDRCIPCGSRSTRDIFTGDVGGSVRALIS